MAQYYIAVILKIKNMKNQILSFTLFSVMMLVLSGCAAIEGIFKAGMWSGIFIVVIIVALIFWLISRAGKK